MTIAPARELGALGVITDVDSYDLPFNAFSMGVNARFEDKRISRGPVFSTVGPIAGTGPQALIAYKPLIGTPVTLIADLNGRIRQWSQSTPTGSPTDTDLSITGYVNNVSALPYTAVINNNILYVNRPDRVPWYIPLGGTQFTALPNWDPTWRCQVLRSVGSAIIAINVTKGATAYPTMVKTSDFTTFGAVPGTWVAATTNNASENVLPDLSEPLTDGHPLRSNMVLYSTHETWLMSPSGDNNIWNYARIFGGPDESSGAINANCVAQYNNTHYVFGFDDIWAHDGFTRRTVSAGRVRNFIYNNMVKSQANLFFTVHNPKLNEIMFCYTSVDPYCAFPVGGNIGYPGCNRAAVYNYRADTWYFYDLPYVTGATITVPLQGLRYTDLTTTPYTSLAGSYQSFQDASKLSLMMSSAAAGPVTQGINAFELPNAPTGTGLIATAANSPVFLENKGLDLDDLGKQLRMYGVMKAAYPEGRFDPGAQPLMFAFGGADYANAPPPAYGPTMTFDGNVNYKLDYTVHGRYLSIQITFNDTKNFTLSGIDFDLAVIGQR